MQHAVTHILVSNFAGTGVHADNDRPECQFYKYHLTLVQMIHELFIHQCSNMFPVQQLAPHYPKAGANHEDECTKPRLQHGHTACVVLASFLDLGSNSTSIWSGTTEVRRGTLMMLVHVALRGKVNGWSEWMNHHFLICTVNASSHNTQ